MDDILTALVNGNFSDMADFINDYNGNFWLDLKVHCRNCFENKFEVYSDVVIKYHNIMLKRKAF